MLKRKDGQIDHIETPYNDIFMSKEGDELSMAFQLKGWDFTQSVDQSEGPRRIADRVHAADDDGRDLSGRAQAHPDDRTRRRHDLDLSRPPHARRSIDTVEIDPGVITAAKKYFGIRESARVRYLDGDGRVFLNRNKQPYDLILCDAFHGGYIPFHLLTKEFFRLVKKHLTPNGAVAINVHDGTKLYVSTIVTHAGGISERASLSDRRRRSDRGRHDAAARATRMRSLKRAAELQEKFKFRYPLPELMREPHRQCRRLAGRDADRRFRAGRSLQRAAGYAAQEEAVSRGPALRPAATRDPESSSHGRRGFPLARERT